jgi:hypothetical protein
MLGIRIAATQPVPFIRVQEGLFFGLSAVSQLLQACLWQFGSWPGGSSRWYVGRGSAAQARLLSAEALFRAPYAVVEGRFSQAGDLGHRML